MLGPIKKKNKRGDFALPNGFLRCKKPLGYDFWETKICSKNNKSIVYTSLKIINLSF